MNRINHLFCSIVVAGSLSADVVLASDKPAKLDPKMQEMMKKIQEAGTPGPAHKALDPLVGEWSAEVKLWMAPGAPPNITKGTAKSTWILGGWFVQQEFNGEFMGKPFRGIGMTGYDNMKKKYSSLWMDDVSTGMFTSEGKPDSGGKVITFEGTYACPETGDLDRPSKQVVRIISRDKHVYEMYDPSKGDNFKTMEITYTRK